MGIGIEGLLDVLVAELAADGNNRDPLGDEQRCAGVSEIVHADALHACGFDGIVKISIHGGCRERIFTAKHKHSRMPFIAKLGLLLCLILHQLFRQHARNDNGADAAFVLWCGYDIGGALGFGADALIDANGGFADVFPSKRGSFASAASRDVKE